MSDKSQDEKFLFLPFSHLPLLIGLSYVFGFLLIAYRLRYYGIAPTDLFEAQYLSVGFFPCILSYTVYWIIRFTWRPYEASPRFRALMRRGYPTIFITGLISLTVTWATEAAFTLMKMDNTFLFAINYGLSILFGLFALGAFSYYVRWWWNNPYLFNPYFYRILFTKLPSRRQLANIFFFGFSVIYILFFIIVAYLEVTSVYEDIPQSLGGGKLVRVQLVVDTKYVPSRLVGEKISDESVYTKPVWLVFRSQKGYLLLDDQEQSWLLSLDSVHLVSTIPNPDAGPRNSNASKK